MEPLNLWISFKWVSIPPLVKKLLSQCRQVNKFLAKWTVAWSMAIFAFNFFSENALISVPHSKQRATFLSEFLNRVLQKLVTAFLVDLKENCFSTSQSRVFREYENSFSDASKLSFLDYDTGMWSHKLSFGNCRVVKMSLNLSQKRNRNG